MNKQGTKNKPLICIPRLAVEELDQVELMSPEFSMNNLVTLVNSAVERFHPQANDRVDKRVSSSFTVRTLRHYQTLGCLDAPRKDGRRAIYGFRHYLQALLIRKLLYLRCSPGSIRITLEGQTNIQYKEMLFADLQIALSKQSVANLPSKQSSKEPVSTSESWTRITLDADAELHLKKQPGRMSPARKKEFLKHIEQYLKKH
ncbi:helix-turn-helix domain-containing protein [bacterium]|nr:helix-turn-helix domain-containing protein [bacterium]